MTERDCDRCGKTMRPYYAPDESISGWLCTTCLHDTTVAHRPRSATESENKPTIREKITREVADYLSAGGQIQQVDHRSNHSFNQPVKRTRKEQIRHRKQSTYHYNGRHTNKNS